MSRASNGLAHLVWNKGAAKVAMQSLREGLQNADLVAVTAGVLSEAVKIPRLASNVRDKGLVAILLDALEYHPWYASTFQR